MWLVATVLSPAGTNRRDRRAHSASQGLNLRDNQQPRLEPESREALCRLGRADAHAARASGPIRSSLRRRSTSASGPGLDWGRAPGTTPAPPIAVRKGRGLGTTVGTRGRGGATPASPPGGLWETGLPSGGVVSARLPSGAMPSDRRSLRKRTRSKIGSLKGPHSRVISCDAGCTRETPADESHPGGSVPGREDGATAAPQAGWRASLGAVGASTRGALLKLWAHRCLGLLLLASCALLLGLCYYVSACESPPPPAGPLTPRPPGRRPGRPRLRVYLRWDGSFPRNTEPVSWTRLLPLRVAFSRLTPVRAGVAPSFCSVAERYAGV